MSRLTPFQILVVVLLAVSSTALGQEPVTPEITKPASTVSGVDSPREVKRDEPVKADSLPVIETYVFPTRRERFNSFVKSTVGKGTLLRTAFSAGLAQWHDNPEEWGQGMKGYGKRFASKFGSNAVQQSVTYGLDQAFELDTGFQKSERIAFWPRFKDALAQNITSRTKRGKRVISVPRIAGAYAGGVVTAEVWYPERYSYKDGLRAGTYSLLSGFGLNLIREFIVPW